MITEKEIELSLVNLSQLTFEVTDACNLKCKYCGYGDFYSDYDERKSKNFPLEKAYAIIDFLISYWESPLASTSSERKVNVGFYGGEPLLNVRFIDNVIEYIKRKRVKNRKFTFSMTTNGILIDKYADFLVKNKFNLLISLDGNKEHHSYRVDKNGLNSFDKVIENVIFLKTKYPQYFESNVNFNAVLHNRNSYEGICSFVNNTFNKVPSIVPLNNMGIRIDKRDEFNKIYRDPFDSLFESEHYDQVLRTMFIKSATYQSLSTFIFKNSDSVYTDYNELLFGKYALKYMETGTCIPFSKKMFVTVNGKILPCERIGHQFAMGAINIKNEVELDLSKIAHTHNLYVSKLQMQCRSCKIKKSCRQCIYNVESLDTNPICYGHTNLKMYKDYIKAQMSFLEKHPTDYYKVLDEVRMS